MGELRRSRLFLSRSHSFDQDSTEPEEGTFTFTQSDQLVALAKEYGQIVRGESEYNGFKPILISSRSQLCMVQPTAQLGHLWRLLCFSTYDDRSKSLLHHRWALQGRNVSLLSYSVNLSDRLLIAVRLISHLLIIIAETSTF